MIKVKNVDAMVWCRNGNVCREATPCEKLTCEYKLQPKNILDGIHKCQSYQITMPSSNWACAYHLENDLSMIGV